MVLLVASSNAIFLQWDSFFRIYVVASTFVWIVPWLQFSGAHEQKCQRAKDVWAGQDSEHNLPLSVSLLLDETETNNFKILNSDVKLEL